MMAFNDFACFGFRDARNPPLLANAVHQQDGHLFDRLFPNIVLSGCLTAIDPPKSWPRPNF